MPQDPEAAAIKSRFEQALAEAESEMAARNSTPGSHARSSPSGVPYRLMYPSVESTPVTQANRGMTGCGIPYVPPPAQTACPFGTLLSSSVSPPPCSRPCWYVRHAAWWHTACDLLRWLRGLAVHTCWECRCCSVTVLLRDPASSHAAGAAFPSSPGAITGTRGEGAETSMCKSNSKMSQETGPWHLMPA